MPNVKKNLDRLTRAAQQGLSPDLSHEAQLRGLQERLTFAFDPALFAEVALKFKPDPWQEKLLRSESKKIIVNVARQQGKSTTAAAKGLHRAIFFPKSLVLIVAPAIKQAVELRRRIDDHLKSYGEDVSKKSDNRYELELDNGSRIIVAAADSDTIRSYTANMVIEDESAMVPDVVHETVKPMLLTTNGQHILLSTPKGMREHHFPSIWFSGKGWERYEVNAWQNVRMSRAVRMRLEEEKADLESRGRLWHFQQEYECSFVAAAQGLVYPFDRGRNSSPALPRDPRHGWQYILGIDYGFNDSTAFVVLGWQHDDPNVYIIESMDKRGLTPAEAAEIAHGYTKKYPFARIVGDTGGLGKGYVEEARRRFRLPIEPAEKNNKRGYIEIMAGDLRAGLLKVFPGNDALIDEWQKLPWDEERERPADGHKDHLSDAALYGYRATLHYLEEARKPRPAKGTPEALLAEAEAIFEQRLKDVTKKDQDWWEAEEPTWLDQEIAATPFLN